MRDESSDLLRVRHRNTRAGGASVARSLFCGVSARLRTRSASRTGARVVRLAEQVDSSRSADRTDGPRSAGNSAGFRTARRLLNDVCHSWTTPCPPKHTHALLSRTLKLLRAVPNIESWPLDKPMAAPRADPTASSAGSPAWLSGDDRVHDSALRSRLRSCRRRASGKAGHVSTRSRAAPARAADRTSDRVPTA